jgi:hypothetical protein
MIKKPDFSKLDKAFQVIANETGLDKTKLIMMFLSILQEENKLKENV